MPIYGFKSNKKFVIFSIIGLDFQCHEWVTTPDMGGGRQLLFEAVNFFYQFLAKGENSAIK